MNLSEMKNKSENEVFGCVVAARISKGQKKFLEDNKISFSIVARAAINELIEQAKDGE